jgi:hypothetical protein
MDVWPALPLTVGGNVFSISCTDNIIAVLWQSNRVCHVDLWDLAGWQLIGRSLDCDARAILGADTSVAHVPVIPTPATLQLVWHPISGIAKTAFVCYSPCPTLAHQYSSFQVYFTRSDDHRRSHLRAVKSRITLPLIPLSMISFQRGHRILRGLRDWNRHPSTRRNANYFLQSD